MRHPRGVMQDHSPLGPPEGPKSIDDLSADELLAIYDRLEAVGRDRDVVIDDLEAQGYVDAARLLEFVDA